MYRFREFMMGIEKSHINNSKETVELSKASRNYCPSRPYPRLQSLIGIEAFLVIFSGLSFFLFSFFLSVFLRRRRISILVRISISNFLFLSRSKQNKGGESSRKMAFEGWPGLPDPMDILSPIIHPNIGDIRFRPISFSPFFVFFFEKAIGVPIFELIGITEE